MLEWFDTTFTTVERNFKVGNILEKKRRIKI